ncbi:MAG: glutamine--fructose-6-phosphate transaminase (isomerizing) [Clostridia bacterium]|nr:glutamine--fructose-6-phosphate transaminase (isomerizing) [Clostridia bacterium]
MCGIVGYIGSEEVETKLINALKLLEYRGYDSSGIAVKTGDGIIKITKEVGKIANLEKAVEPMADAIIGIGHTRWATHGKATRVNAHPHSGTAGEWHIVHNGIIENYAKLKAELVENGVQFASDTDSEVIAQLLERQNDNTNIEKLMNVTKKLSGSWALACIEKNSDLLYLAKNKSPLYVAIGKGGAFVASDPICFNGLVDDYYSLNDGEFAELNKTSVEFFDFKGNKFDKTPVKMTSFETGATKGEYDHFMLKEINETPKALRRLVEVYSEGTVLEHLDIEKLNSINRIKIVGCGTAYNSGVIGAMKLERSLGIEASCYVASEFRYSDPIINENTLCIFVSQSGETADTLACLELANSKGATTIAITNVAYSTIARNADYVLPICAGPEIAVASTKAYVCQLAVFYCLANHIANKIRDKAIDYIKSLNNFVENLTIDNSEDEIKQIAKGLLNLDKVFFIGRGEDAITADEASLKLKEISYINSNSYPSGELKHGFLALVEEGTPIVVICTNNELLEKTLNGANEAAARGGRIILVTPFEVNVDNYKIDHIIKLQSSNEDLLSLEAVIPLQLLAYYTSTGKGIDPDKPRNLAKSVTVE